MNPINPIKINYFELEKEELDILMDVLHSNINRPKNKVSNFLGKFFHFEEQGNRFTSRDMNSNDKTKPIIDIASKYFNRYGYQNEDISHNNYYIELIRYKCIVSDPIPLDVLGLHEDDGATTKYKVNTMIFYLEKSENIKGGDLLVQINNKNTIIPIKKGMAIAFRGNLLHVPTKCLGEGIRECIVFQIERK